MTTSAPAPRLLYVDPEEEITDLVERIRGSADASELVFVLPNRSHVLSSPLNFRLLQQYSRAHGKPTAVVTGDPRVQVLSRQAGLPTYASVQAYERGVEVVRPHPAVEPAHDDAVPVVGLAGVGAAAAAASAAGTGPWAGGAAPPTAGARGAAGGGRSRAWYYGAAAVFVVGLLLLFLVAPSAKVTITLAAQPVSVSPTVQGSTDSTQAGQPDHVVTTVQSADESAGFQAKPTGTKTVPAASATGQVVFYTDLPNVSTTQPTFVIPKNEEFDTNDNPPIRFFATQDTPVTFSQPGGPSNPVPVQDGSAEARGNVAANTITQWPENPCNPGGAYSHVCSSKDITVTNPQPTSGGADEQHLVVASDQDVSSYNAQVQKLTADLTSKVKQDMQSRSQGMTPAVDPGGSGTTISTDVNPAVPRAGDQFNATTITVTVHGKAAYYNAADVHKVVEADLRAQVQQGEQLAPHPSIKNCSVTQASDDGTVIISCQGSGFGQPVVDPQGLKGQLTHQSPSTVQRLVKERIGPQVQSVQIDQSPIPFFVLPFFSSRIDVVENVVAQQGAGA